MALVKNNLKINTNLVGRGYTLQNKVKNINKFGFIIVIKTKRDTSKYFINYLRLW